ncbi:hypothetical protein [Streptomyces violaceusniger]|uniref:PD(D/E)XK endonuclease domain-containing protein n=1 Tax=Streptomyces violaceusniger (strain Tu 4113) TaxID=653045 RepID=G2PE07_STRV4|nr:hypothetical protein [Streptomyces violaceusniger]AEM82835.1 hypothetical protein Strvi_3140 [Streptomyces violaceusniger Tu 4113]
MTSFQQRKAIGDAHERYVAEQLAGRGWEVDFWGQGQLSRALQCALRKTGSSIRWFPDLIAAKAKDLVLIDCKGGMTSRQTGRHAVERAAVVAHLQLVAWTQLPVYYVFDGLDARSPYDVLVAGQKGPHSIAGSGAPYVLISTQGARHFDDLFGTPDVAQLDIAS